MQRRQWNKVKIHQKVELESQRGWCNDVLLPLPPCSMHKKRSIMAWCTGLPFQVMQTLVAQLIVQSLDVRCYLSKYQAEGNGNLIQVQVLQHQYFRIQCFTSLWKPLHPAHWALLNHAYLSAHILCGTPMMIPSKKSSGFFAKPEVLF